MPKWTAMTLEEMRNEPITDITERIVEWMQTNMTKAVEEKGYAKLDR